MTFHMNSLWRGAFSPADAALKGRATSVDNQHTVHLRVQLGGAALRGAIEVVAAGDVDSEGDRHRRADHHAVDEHALVEAVEREAVPGAEAVIGGREIDAHHFASLDADLG